MKLTDWELKWKRTKSFPEVPFIVIIDDYACSLIKAACNNLALLVKKKKISIFLWNALFKQLQTSKL